MGGESSLAPGFRFHPTDQELVSYYLKRKVCGKPLRFDAISTVDIYKSEPWDLPVQSRLKSRDLEWYFFGALDKKYGNGSRTNRATEQGYWKTTGKDRSVRRNARTVGMKKTLVFHIGRAPRGDRTNWVMHEYRLEDEELGQAGIPQDAFVLCRIFQKSGSGPKNGEQYGAPFVEEEWDDEVLVPKQDSDGGLPAFVEPQGYAQQEDNHEQESGTDLEDPVGFLDMINDDPSFLGHMRESSNLPEPHDDQKFDMDENIDLREQCQMFPPVEDESYMELNDFALPSVVDFPCSDTADENQIYFDALAHNPPTDDEFFLEMKDILNPNEADASGFGLLDEYIAYFDATDDTLHHMASDSSNLLEAVDSVLDPPILPPEVGGEIMQYLGSPQASQADGVEGASSSNKKSESNGGSRDKVADDVPYEGGWNKSLVKRVHDMLGSIPSPPAFAAEYPVEGMTKTVGQTSATQSSGSFHVNAGIICVSGLAVSGDTKQLSLRKNGHLGFFLSYGMGGSDVMATEHLISSSVSFDAMTSIPGRVISVLTGSGFSLCFVWATLVLAISFKIGSFIFA
ncbi:NAC domain-containing protein 78-like isoform X2 [Tasmannia lanceolata]|uniref:NAC domain-containing protein 78-like isoform X2 n=1 Tax=Tasmannia lanceolata TaxID=3420 RepID=UPI0040635176